MNLAHHSGTRLQALCQANRTARRNTSLFIRPTSIIKDRTARRSIWPRLAGPARRTWVWNHWSLYNGGARAITASDRREESKKSVQRKIIGLDKKVELAQNERGVEEKPTQLIGKTAEEQSNFFFITCTLGLLFLLNAGGRFFYNEVYSWEPFNTPPRFSGFELEEREQLSSTSMLITAPPIRSRVGSLLENDTDYYKEQWGFGTWSVEIKQPQLQISREYTPLPPNAGSPEKLRLYIRKEKGGEMSNYLWGLKEKGKLGLRGPKLGFELKEGITDVVFLAGGTGIAPALQVAYTLLERRKYEMDQSRPKIRILWANREREELQCADQIATQHHFGSDENHTGISTTSNISHKIQNPVVKIITELQQKHPGCLKVMYLVDEEGTMINQKLISSAMKRDEKTIQRDTNTSMYSKLLFVSGPEGFVNHFAGPKKWQGGGEQQGGVGGILGNMGITGWKVWKL